MVVTVIQATPEAEADPDYHQKRPLLVQPVPEPRPICHVEYEVGIIIRLIDQNLSRIS